LVLRVGVREADTAGLEGALDHSALRAALDDGLHEVVDRTTDVLQRGAEDVVLVLGERGLLVLVGVHADRPDLGLRGRLDDALAGETGRVVDHVGAGFYLTLRSRLALVGTGESPFLGG